MFPISSSRRRFLRYFRTRFRFRHFPTSSSRKSFLRPTFSKPTTLPEPPFPNLAVTRSLTYYLSWFLLFFLFFAILLYCFILQVHLSTRMYAVWSSAVRNFTPEKKTWLWFPDHFAFCLVNNSSEKWCLSVEFLPFQLTRQCRGGPLGSWLPVARLAIPSHGEPAKQGQGCQRENQATIRYLAACQVFFHLPGVSSWLSQKIPRSNFARKGNSVHCIIAKKHHQPVSQRASKPDLFLIF